MEMTSNDLKRLNRAAIEPARVFARRDFDPNDSRPVLHFAWGRRANSRREFYSPHFPTWMFEAGDDIGVIDKAIVRYGMKEAPVTGQWWDFAEFLFDRERGKEVALPEPEIRQMTNGAQVPFYWLGGIDFVAATPVMYALRRFGPKTYFTLEGKFVRVCAEDRVVGVIRIQDGSYLSEPVSDLA